MSAYDFKPLGGSLKFKSGSKGAESGKGEKKKSKSKSRSSTSSEIKSGSASASASASASGSKPIEGHDGQGSSSSASVGRPRTEAEKRFEEVQAKRMREKILKEARKTHKEKVDDFNRYLEGLSEHHDIPKVGPG